MLTFFHIDKAANKLYERTYPWCGRFQEGCACVRKETGRWTFIDKSGDELFVLPEFQLEPTGMREGMVRIKSGIRYGFLGRSGGVEITPQYLFADSFSEGLAVVRRQNGFNFINQTGVLQLASDWSLLDVFFNGRALARRNQDWYFINHDFEVVLGPYSFAWSYSDGVAMVLTGGRYLYIDTDGRVLFEGDKHGSAFHSEGRISFGGPNGYGIRDTRGKVIVEPIYDSVHLCRQGVSVARKEHSAYALGKDGQVLFQIECEEMDVFSENMAAVCVQGSRGFVNLSGQFVVPPSYCVASAFSEGVAAVALNI